MAATTITRDALTDSTAANNGEIVNAAAIAAWLYDNIDALFVASLTISRPSSGDIAFTVENASNTAGSDAQVLASVAGTSAGDPFATFTVTSGSSFSIGVDNSDSDTFKISNAAALGSSDMFGITTGGRVHIGSTFANAFMTVGLTINQGAADDEVLSAKSSDIAHGVTTLADTDTYWQVLKHSPTTGGVAQRGYSEGTTGFSIAGVHTTDDTTHTAAGLGAISLNAALRTGTGVTACGANANLVVVQNNGSTRMIVDAEGDIFYDGAAPANYDRWDDVALLRSLDRLFAGPDLIETAWDQFVTYRRADLERAGILSPNGGFVNLTKHSRLLNGAIWQLHQRLARLEAA